MEETNKDITAPRTYTFLFTDIEGSTRLLQKLGDDYAILLVEQQRLLRKIFEEFRGQVSDTAGDSFFVVFESFEDAVRSAISIKEKVAVHPWAGDSEVKIRIGIHTGEAVLTASGYVGIDIHLAARIMSAGHGGQILLSEISSRLAKNITDKYCGISHLGKFHLKDIPDPQNIYQLNIRNTHELFPPLKAEMERKDNLPEDIADLFGRDDDIDAVTELLLKSTERLVTITGPGGMGKTSLALNVCKKVSDEFDDGVYAVMLSSLRDRNYLTQTIAETLGYQIKGKDNELGLAELLKGKKMLLYLDNFEQLIDAAGIVGNLLGNCRKLKILVTSRIPLRLMNESVYALPHLRLPDAGNAKSAAEALSSPAVRMFEECARRVLRGFRVTDENAGSVSEICIRLDGLPLAIELACARVNVFSPGQIATHLDKRLSLLKSVSADRPERHQTLRDTIAWSYELLGSKERQSFEALSLFRGGFTLEAAFSLLHDTFSDIMEAADLMQKLVEENLLTREIRHGAVRFNMLETIREFAGECLSGSDAVGEIRTRYCDHYLKLAEEANRHLNGEEIRYWLTVMENDIANIRYALELAAGRNDTETAWKITAATSKYNMIRGNLEKTYSETEAVLGMTYDESLKLLRAELLNGIATIVHELSRFKLALPLVKESLELFAEAGNREGILSSSLNLSWVYTHLGELDTSEEILESIRGEMNPDTDKRMISLFQNNLGWLNFQRGNYHAARKCFEEGLHIKREINDVGGCAFLGINLGWMENMLGNFERGEEIIRDSVREIDRIGDNQLMGWAMTNMSFLCICKCLFEDAEKFLMKSFEILKEVSNEWVLAYENALYGAVLIHTKRLTEAEKSLSTAHMIFKESGSRMGLVMADFYRGVMELKREDHGACIRNIQLAYSGAEQLGNMHYMVRCLELAAVVLSKSGRMKEADMLVRICNAQRIQSGLLKSPVELLQTEGVGENLYSNESFRSFSEAEELFRTLH